MTSRSRFKGSEVQGVEDKLRAAAKLLVMERGKGVVSMTALCRAAGVNRSNIYAHHLELVRELIGHKRPAVRTRNHSLAELKQKIRDQKKLTLVAESNYRAVLLLYIEAQAEVKGLKTTINYLRSQAQ